MRIRLSANVFLLLAALAVPAAVRADCQPVESVEAALAGAEVAFVGTALQTVPGKGAVFRVEEAWVGQLGSSIAVGGLKVGGPAGFAEDDRIWEVGQRYLVIPYLFQGRLVDHLCSGTTPWSNELAALRPPNAMLAAPAAPAASPPWPVLIAGALVLTLTITAWLAFRRTDAAR